METLAGKHVCLKCYTRTLKTTLAFAQRPIALYFARHLSRQRFCSHDDKDHQVVGSSVPDLSEDQLIDLLQDGHGEPAS